LQYYWAFRVIKLTFEEHIVVLQLKRRISRQLRLFLGCTLFCGWESRPRGDGTTDEGEFSGGRIWVIRIDPGEDALLALRSKIREKGITQAVVVSGYGTFARARLHWVAHNRFPTDNLFEEFEGGIELMSMNGMIVDGEPHIHFTAATPKGAFGGHLEEGCIVYVLCEVVLVELDGPRMRRVEAPAGVDECGNPVDVPRLSFDGD
jgi:predicted DNA-binding protein with PD1-like motif